MAFPGKTAIINLSRRIFINFHLLGHSSGPDRDRVRTPSLEQLSDELFRHDKLTHTSGNVASSSHLICTCISLEQTEFKIRRWKRMLKETRAQFSARKLLIAREGEGHEQSNLLANNSRLPIKGHPFHLPFE
ncbi:hypothetical protein CDAR_457311 [Caerostris darwini]|uniref:Uncharacterized protein n=1 Tax=Caerostris darwini TaxID=1538125 RepID=A0AAV4PBK7_9ARAC|nr:hypothetical protein CDAR_457311 [Caerostris darwini]